MSILFESSAFDILSASGCITAHFLSVCVSPWTCRSYRPSLFVSNINLIRAVLWGFLWQCFVRPLPLAPYLFTVYLWKNNSSLIQCHLRVWYSPSFTASYSDSYSSDEDDVSPRERSQVCIQVYFFLDNKLFSLILLSLRLAALRLQFSLLIAFSS